jgi:hypothetical protein
MVRPASPPSQIGHVLAVLLGLQSIVDGVLAATHGMPKVLVAAVTLVGVLLPVLAALSYVQRSRAAWSFMISICGVFAIVTVFGAPKVAHLGMPLVFVALVPLLYITTVVLLSMSASDYVGAVRSK